MFFFKQQIWEYTLYFQTNPYGIQLSLLEYTLIYWEDNEQYGGYIEDSREH